MLNSPSRYAVLERDGSRFGTGVIGMPKEPPKSEQSRTAASPARVPDNPDLQTDAQYEAWASQHRQQADQDMMAGLSGVSRAFLAKHLTIR